MIAATIEFNPVRDVKQSERRAVGFLVGHGQLDAKAAFDGLNDDSKRAIKTYMDAWVDGAAGPSNRFHGFPTDLTYKMCFVFKIKQDQQGHRFYGYLINPQPVSNPRFRVCVICVHATKNEKETDRSELARVKSWSESEAAKQAVMKKFLR